MSSDELQIRQLVSTWMSASQAGDVDTVLSLMTDEVVFLMPGAPPMLKADFERASRAHAGPDAATFAGQNEIEELQVLGDWAFMRSKLKVTVTPPGGAKPIVRAGYTLTIFQKQNGKWLLARDANLLVTMPEG